MRYVRVLILGLACLSTLLGAARHAAVSTAQSSQAQPFLAMTGLQLPDQVRYSLTLGNTAGATISNLQVQIQLPGDATFGQALETPGVTQFQGNQNGTLSWTALTSFGPNDPIDPFAFSLQQPATGSFGVHISWSGDNPGQEDAQLQPAVTAATATTGQLTLTADMLNGGFVPVGDTGVQVAATGDNSVPAGTTITVTRLGPDANPPGGTGDLWWCAMVELDGLPAGADLEVVVPTRQPLAPGVAVSLFAPAGASSSAGPRLVALADGRVEQDTRTWSALSQQGSVTVDGQAVSFQHPGGPVAAGTSPSFQQSLAGTTFNPNVSRQGTINSVSNSILSSGTFVQQQTFIAQMIQGNTHCNSGGHCSLGGTPLPQCNAQILTSFVRGQTVTSRCANAGFDGSSGTVGDTLCEGNQNNNNQVTSCVGWVPALTGGRTFSLTPGTSVGLGTRCTFPTPQPLNPQQEIPFNCFDSQGPP